MGIYNLQWDEIYYLQSTDNEQKRPISENVKQLFSPYVCVIEVSVCQFDSYVGVSLSVWCKGGVQNANSRKNYILFFDSNLGGLRKTNHSMPKYVMG